MVDGKWVGKVNMQDGEMTMRKRQDRDVAPEVDREAVHTGAGEVEAGDREAESTFGVAEATCTFSTVGATGTFGAAGATGTFGAACRTRGHGHV